MIETLYYSIKLKVTLEYINQSNNVKFMMYYS